MSDAEDGFLKAGAMTIEEFCYIFRTCSFQILRDHSVFAVLTSKRVQ